jgi:uncharacterized glyoxalase superfamily metalloenzyme YdcJ
MASQSVNLTHLLSLGLLEYEPITYEDFLPFSAAGIFKSNVGDGPQVASGSADREDRYGDSKGSTHRETLESALGCEVFDEFELYAALERDSIKRCEQELSLQEIVVA